MLDGRLFEERGERNLAAELTLDLHQQAQREKRMAAEIEEAVGDADGTDVED